MKDKNYNRNVSLLCPTCGCSQFLYENGVDETIEISKCASCAREVTKDELIHENSENIDEHVKEIGKSRTDDVAKQLRESLKRAFKSSKNIRIK